MTTPYEVAIERLTEIDAEVTRLSGLLQAFQKGTMGLTPDEVRLGASYREVKRAYDNAFAALREANSYVVSHYPKEHAAARADRRRSAKL